MKPQNFAERLIWVSILWTYGFYAIGGLYIWGAFLPWILLGYLVWKLWHQSDATPPDEKIAIPWSVWVWVIGMLVMQLALVVGHISFNLGLGLTIKSSIGWAKGWALMALYPLVGCLNIRPQLLYRAACKFCAITLVISVPLIMAFYLHLPQKLYVSPLQAVGGPGPDFFEVRLYEIDPGDGKPRWRLFTPWAPALGFMANIYFFMALQERDRRWRWVGMTGCIYMCLISASRLALLSLTVVWLLTFVLSKLSRPLTLIGLGISSFVGSMAANEVLEAYSTFSERFTAARKDSSRVRDALGRIAVYRWENEAPIWGHGTVEGGPHLVEFMPIGSHHSWYGLLFVKGMVGFAALSVPMVCSGADLLIKAQKSETAKVGLSMFLVLFLYTFGENLEILAYLIWPGLVMMGIGFNAKDAARPVILERETRQLMPQSDRQSPENP
jgi:hypothetical protein